MKSRLLLLITILLFLPHVSAQIIVTSHDVSYELRGDDVLVVESISFVNPATSDNHTFYEEIVLTRGRLKNLEVIGVPGSLNNDTPINTIHLDFSKDPIIRTATDNSRTVTLIYSTSDFSSEAILNEDRKVYFFSGNVLPDIPSEFGAPPTSLDIELGEGFQFGTIKPPTTVTDKKHVSFFMTTEDRRVYTAFIVEILHADFENEAITNIGKADKKIKEANSKIEDAENSIESAEVYNSSLENARNDLELSIKLLGDSSTFLSLSEEALDQQDHYTAFLFSNTSIDLVDKAFKAASDSQRESNLKMRLAINEKISQLENITSAAAQTPVPTVPPEKEVEVEKPTSPPPSTPQITAPAQQVGKEEPKRGPIGRLGLIFILVLIMLGSALLLNRRKKVRKGRLAGVKDFRSISDLKRKSYKGFEEKVDDVKKETTLAGEIMHLQKGIEKYELGIENLEKMKVAGEITDSLYSKEKTKFEGQIKEISKRISLLEKKIPKKGGADGKSISNRPKKGEWN
jgi:hypothetical protein